MNIPLLQMSQQMLQKGFCCHGNKHPKKNHISHCRLLRYLYHFGSQSNTRTHHSICYAQPVIVIQERSNQCAVRSSGPWLKVLKSQFFTCSTYIVQHNIKPENSMKKVSHPQLTIVHGLQFLFFCFTATKLTINL